VAPSSHGQFRSVGPDSPTFQPVLRKVAKDEHIKTARYWAGYADDLKRAARSIAG